MAVSGLCSWPSASPRADISVLVIGGFSWLLIGGYSWLWLYLVIGGYSWLLVVIAGY